MGQKRVLKNAVWIIGTQIIKSILGLFISIFTARYLGPNNFGIINYAASIVAFAIPIMQLGFTSILVQELVSNPNDEGTILGTSIISNLISGFFCLIGVMSFVLIANHGESEVIVVCALYSTLIIVQALDLIKYWYQSKLLSKYTSIVSLIAYFVISSYKIFLLVSGKSVEWFALSNSFDYLIISVVLLILYKKLGGSKMHYSFTLFKKMIKKSKYYILSGLMITIFAQTDKIMLKFIIDDAETGYYSVAVAISGMSVFIFTAVLDSARPMIFQSKKEDETLFKKNVIDLYSIIFYLAIIQSIFITVLANPIVHLLYGKEYVNSINPLRVAIWYTIFSYIGSARNIWLLAENKQKLLWKIDVSGAIANVVLNAILIPYFGAVGAAVASLVTQFFTNIVMIGIIKETRVNIKYMLVALSPVTIWNLLKNLKHTLFNKEA